MIVIKVLKETLLLNLYFLTYLSIHDYRFGVLRFTPKYETTGFGVKNELNYLPLS